MELNGIRTIYDTEVAYCPGEGLAPQGLDTDHMKLFCSQEDANTIFQIAKQVVQGATLIGGTSDFTATLGQNGILAAGPDQLYAEAASGGRYLYRTADGYRPMRIQAPAKKLDQFVSELVASYDGTKNGLTLVQTGQGPKLQWA